MPDASMSLGWVIVYVDDPPATRAFYMRAFGLQGGFVAPSDTYAELDTGATRLAFAAYALGEGNFPGGVQPAPLDGRPPNVEIALVAQDVDAAFTRALEAGCSERRRRRTSRRASASPTCAIRLGRWWSSRRRCSPAGAML
jgi:predicted enzyme related to lactoylglutathione lyase